MGEASEAIVRSRPEAQPKQTPPAPKTTHRLHKNFQLDATPPHPVACRYDAGDPTPERRTSSRERRCGKRAAGSDTSRFASRDRQPLGRHRRVANRARAHCRAVDRHHPVRLLLRVRPRRRSPPPPPALPSKSSLGGSRAVWGAGPHSSRITNHDSRVDSRAVPSYNLNLGKPKFKVHDAFASR